MIQGLYLLPLATAGGLYYRKAGSREHDGHIAETAFMNVLAKRPKLSTEHMRKGLNSSIEGWLSNGYTTASELGLGLSSDDVDMVSHSQVLSEEHNLHFESHIRCVDRANLAGSCTDPVLYMLTAVAAPVTGCWCLALPACRLVTWQHLCVTGCCL